MTTQEPVIVIDKLEKSYGKIRAVRGISMSVQRGEIFGFLGPNGAGKTTTIRCMLDVIRPSAGMIRVLGLDTQRDKLALHQHIGYLPGEVRLPGQMTGKQVIDYFSRLQGLEPVLLNDLEAPLEEVFLKLYEEPEKATTAKQ
jgi:ABC-2 type transport system ATP-binding protein